MMHIKLITKQIQVRERTVKAYEGDVTRPEDVLPLLGEIRDAPKEHFVCLHLNARNTVETIDTVAIGTLNASLVHPREVFRTAVLQGAHSVILAHNHPSGDTTPSREDLELTRRMVEAGLLIGIEVLDHIIVSSDKFLSLKAGGLM